MKRLLSFVLFFFALVIPFSSASQSELHPVSASSDGDSLTSEPSGLTNVGYAAFNLTSPRFNCSGFLKATSQIEELHVAFLYNTFGNDFSCLKRLLADPRLRTLEIELINEPGHRNGRLGAYEFLSGVGTVPAWDSKMKNRDKRLKAKFQRYVQPLQDVLSEYAQESTSVIVNPGLESNLSDQAGRVLVAWTREVFPSYRVVWNPLSPAPRRRVNTRADFIEGHNLSPKISAPCIYNMDGTDVSFPDRPAIGERSYQEGQVKNWVQSGAPLFQLIENFANKCEVAFVWTAESNGIDEKKSSFVDPRKRNNSIPKERYDAIFAEIKKIHNRGRVYPAEYTYSEQDKRVETSCSKVYLFFEDGEKKGYLLKQSEFRDRGAVLVMPAHLGSITDVQLVKGNRVIDRYESTVRYKDGRLLFRSSRSPTTYPLMTYLTFSQNGHKICYKLPNPRVRLD